LDILRRTPGAGVQELAAEIGQEPEEVWSIVNDPDFKEYLNHTKGTHLAQLQTMHRNAMERLLAVLAKQTDCKKIEELSKWILHYSTDSILKVSEINLEGGNAQQDGSITINQMLGRPDPFATGKKK